VWDVIAAARYVRASERTVKLPIHIAGSGPAGILAAYAALLDDQVAASHMDPAAPQLLNVLRVCDIPDVLRMLAPRPVKVLRAEDL
jgi:hypothetical protein